MVKTILIFLLTSIAAYCQQEEMITVSGDSLVGHMVEGESIREVYGHVIVKQGDVVITCNRAIHFISRNNAELIGNVVAKQDTITIYTPHGFYYGDERRAVSNEGIKLDDQKVILTAKNGDYYFNEDRAFFTKDVKLYDTTTTLTSDSLTYFQNENRAVAVGKVKIIDQENIILADSLQHYRSQRISIADNNVKITSLENNVTIYGGHLEDYGSQSYTLVNENPLLVQVDTTFADSVVFDSSGNAIDTLSKSRQDTLVISSMIMRAYRDTADIFQAIDSVKIVRGEFASKNDFTVYYRTEQKIVTSKTTPEAKQPVLWFDNSQLTGDSVVIYLQDNDIRLLQMNKNGFILSQNKIYPDRFDQIAGDTIKINFNADGIESTEVTGTVYSIYYLYEDSTKNGLIKATSQKALIRLNDDRVNEVRLYGSPRSEYYPENQVAGEELTYTLPGFKKVEGRPEKDGLLLPITGYRIPNLDPGRAQGIVQ